MLCRAFEKEQYALHPNARGWANGSVPLYCDYFDGCMHLFCDRGGITLVVSGKGDYFLDLPFPTRLAANIFVSALPPEMSVEYFKMIGAVLLPPMQRGV